ncbi:MAG: rRNA maturation RNase YbeY [Acidobacteria bacterium]|nr:rRNA maturation RNase YbeY [Acidobacteriota bacterium]
MSVELENESGVSAPLEEILQLADFALAKMHIDAKADIEILLVNETVMEQYHLDWMQESGPTDVLSQPIDGLRPGKPNAVTPAGHLGLIVLCPQVASKQALERGHSELREILILIAHSILHLLGYDHAEKEDELEMFALQEEIVEQYLESREL